MPKRNATRFTQAVLASAFCFLSAGWADFCSSVGEVFSVFLAVTGNAQSKAVTEFKPEVGELGPRLYVMGLQVFRASTSLTSEAITEEDIESPFSQVSGFPCSFIVERHATFPCCRFISHTKRHSALSGTGSGSLVATGKHDATVTTGATNRWIAFRPARLRAVFGRCGSVFERLVVATTHRARERDFVFFCCHVSSIQKQERTSKISPAYCDVIVKRWEQLTGQKATIEQPV